MVHIMFTAPRLCRTRTAVALVCAAHVGFIAQAASQESGWGVATPVPALSPSSSSIGTGDARPWQAVSRGPLARLVRNPDSKDGLPPFALTDQSGTIQRYVEPVPGIELDSYVDQVVIVRHDTGRTLLASQIELPLQPLNPLLGTSHHDGSPRALLALSDSTGTLQFGDGRVLRAQFVDDDDASVQLLPDGGPPSSESSNPGETTTRPRESSGSPAAHGTEVQDGLLAPMLEEYEAGTPSDPSTNDRDAIAPYPTDWGDMRPCPHCGGFHAAPECDPTFGESLGPPFEDLKPSHCRLFADVEINFLRTHLVEDAVGKLSEKYEFSPRIIVGFRETDKLDGRVRYWHYGRNTGALGNGSIRVEFNVLDLEGTHLFTGQRSGVLLASGLRLASIDLTDDDDDSAGTDLLGITFAAEGRTRLFPVHDGQLSWVYGGRLSVLGGDWGADPGSDFIDGSAQDDNVVVHELHAGIDYAVRSRDYNFHARLGFEMQNWHSDVLSPNSIGIIGPGIQIGAEF
jgi:hypothetical protein